MPNVNNNYNPNYPIIDQILERIKEKINKECKVKALKININNIIENVNDMKISEVLLCIARNSLFITVPVMITLLAFQAPQFIDFFPHNPHASQDLYYTLLASTGLFESFGIFKLQRNNDKFFNKVMSKMSQNSNDIAQKIGYSTKYTSSQLSDLENKKSKLIEYSKNLNTILAPFQKWSADLFIGREKQIEELLNTYSLDTIVLFLINNRLDELTSYDKSINQVSKQTFNNCQNETDYYRDYYNNYFKKSLIGNNQNVSSDTKNPLYVKSGKNVDNKKYNLTYDQVISMVFQKVNKNLLEARKNRNSLSQIIVHLEDKIKSCKNQNTIEHLKNTRDKTLKKYYDCNEIINIYQRSFNNLLNSQHVYDFITKEKSEWRFSREMVDKLYNELPNFDITVLTQFVYTDLLDALPSIHPSYKKQIQEISFSCLNEIQKYKEQIIIRNQQNFNEILNSNTLPRKPTNFR